MCPGLGFRYDTDEKWALPNPTGLPGVFEGYTPPHYRDMRHAVDALTERKFGRGGPFNPDTPGYYRDTQLSGAGPGLIMKKFQGMRCPAGSAYL